SSFVKSTVTAGTLYDAWQNAMHTIVTCKYYPLFPSCSAIGPNPNTLLTSHAFSTIILPMLLIPLQSGLLVSALCRCKTLTLLSRNWSAALGIWVCPECKSAQM